jgi:hypothetical protein
MLDIIQLNSHTMVHTNTFVVDLNYMQSIKQFTGNLLSMGCISCLYICLYAQFEILQTASCLRSVHSLNLAILVYVYRLVLIKWHKSFLGKILQNQGALHKRKSHVNKCSIPQQKPRD